MFVDFFFFLRSRGIKVSLPEWMGLMEALGRGLASASLTQFYHLCRSLCVKNEAQYDLYDQCFASFFQGTEAPESLLSEVLSWLEDPWGKRELTEEERDALQALDLEALRRLFEERLKEQKERHDGGDRWIGTGGKSPFGHSGTHPSGVRVGGEGGGRSAIQIATERRFRNLRHDLILDTRQIAQALRQLRLFRRESLSEEIDLDGTIDKTARNAGDIDLVWQPERRNQVKLLLLMDVDGSMTPYTRLCERLFSAAYAARDFKAFKHYFFHNCPYETLFSDIARRKGEPTTHVLRQLDESWYCIVIGDAAMSPYELTTAGGAIEYGHHNPDPGIVWLQRIAARFPRCVWLNPEPKDYWETTMSNRMIRQIFTMYPLTLDGLEQGLSRLRSTRM